MHQPQLHLAVALAAQLGRQVGGPQLLPLHLGLQRANDAHEPRLVGVEDLQRIDLVVHKPAHPLELGFELGLGREVPGHASRSIPSSIMPVIVVVKPSYIGSGRLPRRCSMRL